MTTKEQNIKRGVIYVRVSSKDQVDNTSLESQEKACGEYCLRNHIEVVKVFIEQGESAKSADRTEFNKAIQFCGIQKNNIGYFVVYKLDRFARNQEDHVTVRALLKKYGAELKSATEPINDSPIGKAMEGMLSVFAEFDNNVRTERTRGGMLERIRQGAWVWSAPLGYKRVGGVKNISPDELTAPHIKQIFNLYAKGIYTYKAIANLMDTAGMRTRYGKRPRAQLIEKILRNPIYYGHIEAFGEEHKGSFPPLISEELYLSCQPNSKNLKGHAAPRSANNPMYPLRGVVVCEECGTSFTGSTSTGRASQRYSYYHHYKKSCSKAKSIPRESFEQEFVEYLESITPSLKYEKWFKAIVIDIWQNNYKNISSQNQKARLELTRLEAERDRVFTMMRQGKLTDDEFSEQKNAVNLQIANKYQQLNEKQYEGLDMEKTLDACFSFVRNTAKTWREADYAGRLQFQKLVFQDKLQFNGKRFGNAKLSPIYEMNRMFDGNKSSLVAPRGIEPRLPA